MAERPLKRQKTTGGTTDSKITDPRFANIQSDPRYRLSAKRNRVKLDKRFTQKFRSDDFTRHARVDRYGRPVDNEKEKRRLEEKFEIGGEDDDKDESDDPDDDEEVQAELNRVENRGVDLLRVGREDSSSEADSSSESDSDSDSDSDNDSGDEANSAVEEVQAHKETVPIGQVTNRLAVVNLDWDNIKAEDLMAVFSSFLPAGGRLARVSVYPSEFGRERMEREELEGPPKEIFQNTKRLQRQTKVDSDESDQDSQTQDSSVEEDEEEIKNSIIQPDDGADFDSAALRTYQLERLRYFYAVLIFSSSAIAKQIYDAVDGTEYLSTANFFDLRFIPDDTSFDSAKPRDECERLSSNYKPGTFVTDALQHSKVKLTWDADDTTRKDAAARAFGTGKKGRKGPSRTEIEEEDLRAYLGSDTSGDEGEVDQEVQVVDSTKNEEAAALPDTKPLLSKKDAERQRMRAMLGLAPEPTKASKPKDKDAPIGNIQVTFSSGLSSATSGDKSRSVFQNSPEPEETTAERYVRKEKERKQKRRERMKAARNDNGEDAATDRDTSTTMQPTNTAALEVDEPEEDAGFNDPFFADAAETNTQLQKQSRKQDRLKKRAERAAEEAASAKQRAELELLMADDDDTTTTNNNNNLTASLAGSGAEAKRTAGTGRTVRHFDMTEIEKSEKQANGKNKKKKGRFNKEKEIDQTALQNDFRLDTKDPRLGRLFGSHEFAIDPTRQIRETEGTRVLLEEGRKRKQGRKTEVGEAEKVKDREKKRSGDRNGDVKDLVAKIKRRTG